MGMMRNRQIDDFQSKTGIRGATGETEETLDAMSRKAYDLIRIIELERSGIRDGDGLWSGCDALYETVRDLQDLYRERYGD